MEIGQTIRIYDDTAGVWRTVRGRRIFIREGEDVTAALDRSLAKTEARSDKAKSTHKPSTRAKQLRAAKFESLVTKAIGGKRLEDNEPFDVVKGRNAVEVKAILEGKNPKITMHGSSLSRKRTAIRRDKLFAHTVAIDARGTAPVYYYRRGVGSFRLSSMERVTKSELRSKMK